MTDPMSLAVALDLLERVAEVGGIDTRAARLEGEALAATVSDPSTGAFVDWCEQTGRQPSALEFKFSASRGRRYRSAPTALMSLLVTGGSSHAPAYADALADVALAASTLGSGDPKAIGNAATAAAAQLVGMSVRESVPTLGGELGHSVLDQLSVVQRKLAGLDEKQRTTPTTGGPVGSTPLITDPPPVATAPGTVPGALPPAPGPEAPAKDVEELLAELDGLVGLAGVKEEIHQQAAILRVEGLRKDAGLTAPTITRHMIFNGNPGTGKTTVARLVAGIYRALGLLSQGQLIEVDRSELVAGFLGQTAMKTADVVKSAMGGVLFIDEAYSLAGDQYGTEAIDTLVKEMEDKRDDLVVIVAGYPLPMEVFIEQNPGLSSRFRTTIGFTDYTDDELVSIFSVMAKDAQYDAGADVLDRLREVLTGIERGSTFGNARYVRNMLEAAIGRHAWRLRDLEAPTTEQLRTLEADDLDPVAVDPFVKPDDVPAANLSVDEAPEVPPLDAPVEPPAGELVPPSDAPEVGTVEFGEETPDPVAPDTLPNHRPRHRGPLRLTDNQTPNPADVHVPPATEPASPPRSEETS